MLEVQGDLLKCVRIPVRGLSLCEIPPPCQRSSFPFEHHTSENKHNIPQRTSQRQIPLALYLDSTRCEPNRASMTVSKKTFPGPHLHRRNPKLPNNFPTRPPHASSLSAGECHSLSSVLRLLYTYSAFGVFFIVLHDGDIPRPLNLFSSDPLADPLLRPRVDVSVGS